MRFADSWLLGEVFKYSVQIEVPILLALQIASTWTPSMLKVGILRTFCTTIEVPGYSTHHMPHTWAAHGRERMFGKTRRILDSILLEHKNKQLTHDVLMTFLAEVSAIINARPIVPVSTDSDDPFISTPSILLTQKTTNSSMETYPDLDITDMYKSQWKHVQVLADQNWRKTNEFLSLLQKRPKWTTSRPNLEHGDVVLFKDVNVNRNQWPVAVVTQTFPSSDAKVHIGTVRIKVVKDGKPVFYTRPVCELVIDK